MVHLSEHRLQNSRILEELARCSDESEARVKTTSETGVKNCLTRPVEVQLMLARFAYENNIAERNTGEKRLFRSVTEYYLD